MLIQKLRLQRGWSQERLAEVSGVSVRTIQRLERGLPGSLESLQALAAVFEIDFNRLKEPAMDLTESPDVPADEALALAHVHKVKAFWSHLTQFAVFIAFLAFINLMTSPGYLWFLWAAFGLGLGFPAYAASVFGFLDGAWEKRQVGKHLGREL
jgi:transcriptional regulator with XRE-family HTH domain